MMTVTLNDVNDARTAMLEKLPQEDGRTREPILHTPCDRAPWLEEEAIKAWGASERNGLEVWLKLETRQETASFKQRGAYNKLRCLRRDNPGAVIRVYAASAGNHAQGVARHARDFDIEATIVMPTGTPAVKKENTERLLEKPLKNGDPAGRVELVGSNYDEAKKHAEKLFEDDEAASSGAVVKMVHAFNDPAVIAGQGTVALEILEDVPNVEVIAAGVGGGGLVSGIAAAVKEKQPSVAVVGVESAAEPAAYLDRLHRHGDEEPLNIKELDLKLGTIADGISVAAIGEHNAKFLRDPNFVDHILTVQEGEIARAIALMLRKEKILIEGACATTVAALLNKKNQALFAGKKVVLVLSGGNLDPGRLAEIIRWYDFSEFVTRTHQDPDKAWEEASRRPPAA
jgi:threonine dehydratase